jgi:hypothetical protein
VSKADGTGTIPFQIRGKPDVPVILYTMKNGLPNNDNGGPGCWRPQVTKRVIGEGEMDHGYDDGWG